MDFEKNSKAFQETMKSGNKDDTSTSSRDSGNVEDTDYNRKKWNAEGLSMINGVLHIHWKQCGPNTTHSTGLHNAFVKQGPSFKLTLTYPYAKDVSNSDRTTLPLANLPLHLCPHSILHRLGLRWSPLSDPSLSRLLLISNATPLIQMPPSFLRCFGLSF